MPDIFARITGKYEKELSRKLQLNVNISLIHSLIEVGLKIGDSN